MHDLIDEVIHQLHDEHMILLAQHIHLQNDDDFLVARKLFKWIWLEISANKNVCLNR